jgi:chromate transporter
VRGGAVGAAAAGLAFVLPSFVMVLALAAGYLRFGGLPWMQGAFYGIGAAVIAIIGRSAVKLTRITLGGDALLWLLAVAAALVTAWTESEIVWVFLVAGGIGVLVRGGLGAPRGTSAAGLALPAGLLAGLGGPATVDTLWRIAWYFTEAGAFVFGSGLAIVPFLHGGVVRDFGWLTERQFLDAVAVAMITPGPVVITVAFIGYLVAGTPGLLAAAAGVFLPVYLFVVIPAPWFRRMTALPRLQAFVEGVTAGAAGAIGGAAVVLARRAWIDEWTAALGVASLVVLWRWRISELWIITAAGAIGLWVG